MSPDRALLKQLQAIDAAEGPAAPYTDDGRDCATPAASACADLLFAAPTTASAAEGSRSETGHAANALLLRYYTDLTQSFLLPFERYLNGLTPVIRYVSRARVHRPCLLSFSNRVWTAPRLAQSGCLLAHL